MHEAVREKRGPQSKKELVATCHQLRSHVRARRLATDEELADIWPDRPARASVWDWQYAYAQLVRFNGRDERRAGVDAAGADAVALAGMMETPAQLELADGTTVQVHPKSLEALLWLDHHDQLLSWLTEREEELRVAMESGALDPEAVPEPAAVLDRIRREIAHQLSTIAAVACTGESRLDQGVAAAPPPPFDNLSPFDLVRIHLRFVEINVLRLQTARALIRPAKKKGASRPMTWGTLIATAADRLRTDARSLARDRSLVSLLLQVQLAQRPELDELEEG